MKIKQSMINNNDKSRSDSLDSSLDLDSSNEKRKQELKDQKFPVVSYS